MSLLSHSSTFLLPNLPTDNNNNNNDGPPLTTAQVHICADGGANRVFDELPGLFPNEEPCDIRKRYKPHAIKGDMDSIRTEVLDYYKSLGTKIIDESQDQDTTDLHKCVACIRDLLSLEHPNLCILVTGALGGRFDHEMGNINVLCRFPSMRIILLSDDCLIQLLPSTHHHKIHIHSSVEGPHCGLIPIGMVAGSTTTTGLKWNLADFFGIKCLVAVESWGNKQHCV
ncbi:Thiamine pyrophosphokinase 2 [Capsicum annuum]|nr:Thiamine pyrophosphokinase 2 [Capsicum annuum]